MSLNRAQTSRPVANSIGILIYTLGSSFFPYRQMYQVELENSCLKRDAGEKREHSFRECTYSPKTVWNLTTMAAQKVGQYSIKNELLILQDEMCDRQTNAATPHRFDGGLRFAKKGERYCP